MNVTPRCRRSRRVHSAGTPLVCIYIRHCHGFRGLSAEIPRNVICRYVRRLWSVRSCPSIDALSLTHPPPTAVSPEQNGRTTRTDRWFYPSIECTWYSVSVLLGLIKLEMLRSIKEGVDGVVGGIGKLQKLFREQTILCIKCDSWHYIYSTV